MDPDQAARATLAGQQGGVTYVPRSRAEVAAFLSGLRLVEPGVVPMPVRVARPAAPAHPLSLPWPTG